MTAHIDNPPALLAVLACAVMEAEIEVLLAKADHVVSYRKLEQGLHNEPDRLREQLQIAVDQVEDETDAEAIALVYGLCSRGIEGVTTKRCKLVVARGHDCITLLLGSRARYQAYVDAHPGTYWYSPGWNKHHTPPGPERYAKLRQKYVEKYGEDNAQFLMESEQHWFSTYDRAVYVHLTVGVTEQDKQYTRDCADWLKWDYDEQEGDPALLRQLVYGPWDDQDFLVVAPGQTVTLSADERVLKAVPVQQVQGDIG